MANLKQLLQKIWRSFLKLFSRFKSGRRKLPRQSIAQTSSGDHNLNISSIKADSFSFKLLLKEAPPDAKFRLPEPFYPEKLENFTGRRKELIKLAELLIEKQDLEAGKNRAIIYGIPGVGKSALACYFAYYFYYQQNQFPDGVYGLRVDSEGEDTQAIARKFANLCGENINPEDERDATTIMQDLFADRRALLILDNAEQTHIRSLFPSSIECAILITTRISSLPGLLKISPNRQIQLQPFGEDESLELLEQFVGKTRIKVESDYARNIIRKLGNLPLALQVVGATLSTGTWKRTKQSLKEYADALEEEKLELLQREEDNDDVRASFSLSLKNLPSEEQEFFACLSACAESGFSLLTSSAVVGCSTNKARRYLDNLVRYSLVNLAETEQERYILHTLIYEFAKYKLGKNQSLHLEAKNRHASYFLKFIRNNDLDDGDILTNLDQDIEDIILAAEWLVNQETDNYDFVLLLGDFFEQFKYYQQAIDLIQEFRLVAEKRHNWAIVVELSSLQIEFFLLKRNFQQAKTILESIPEAINRIEQPKDQQSCEAMRLRSLSSLFQKQNQLSQAEQTLIDSHKILVSLGEKDRQARVLNKLGWIIQRQERFSEAEEILKQSLDIYEKSANFRGLLKVLTNLGIALYKQNKFEEALYFLERSRLLAEDQLKDQRRLSMILHHLGLVYQEMQILDKAETIYHQSYLIAKEVKDLFLQNTSLKYLLSLFLMQEKLEQSWSLVQELGESTIISIALNQLGKELLQDNNIDHAIKVTKQSIKIAEYYQDKLQKVYGQNILIKIYKRQGKLQDAESLLHQSIDITRELGNQRQLVVELQSLLGILQKQKRFGEAEIVLRESIIIDEDLDDKQKLIEHIYFLNIILRKQNKLEEAIPWLHKSINLYQELGDQKNLLKSQNTLAQVLKQQGKWEEAQTILRQIITLSSELKNKRQLVISLTLLLGVLKRQGELEGSGSEIIRMIFLEEQLDNEETLIIAFNILGDILQKQGKLEEAESIIIRCINLSEEFEDKQSLVEHMNLLSLILRKQNKLEEVIPWLHKSINFYQELGDQKNLRKSLNVLAGILKQQSKLEEAECLLRQSIDITRKLGNQRQLVVELQSLLGILQTQKRFEEAEIILRESIIIDEDLDDKQSLVKHIFILNLILREQNKLEETIPWLHKSIAIYQELGDEKNLLKTKKNLLKSLNILGGTLQKQGRLEKVESIILRCISLSGKFEDKQSLVEHINLLNLILRKQNKLEEAIPWLQRGIDLYQELGDQKNLSKSLNDLAGVLKQQSKLEEAECLLRQSIDIARKLGDQRQLVIKLQSLLGILQKQERFEEAEKVLHESIIIDENLDDKQNLVNHIFRLNLILRKQKKLEETIPWLHKSIAIHQELGDQNNLLKTQKNLLQSLHNLGLTLKKKGKLEEAENNLQRAYDLSVELKDLKKQAYILKNLGLVFQQQQKFDQAIHKFRNSINIGKQLNNKSHLATVYAILEKSFIVLGMVKVNHYPKKKYGFIHSDGLSSDIIFHRDYIERNVFSQLRPGTLVEVEVKIVRQGYAAEKIKILKQRLQLKDKNNKKQK